MQPILDETMESGSPAWMLRSLRSRRRIESSFWVMEYVPADPQQRCDSANGTSLNPIPVSTLSTELGGTVAIRFARLDVAQLAIAKAHRKLLLGDGIRPRGSATKMRFGERHQLESDTREHFFSGAAQSLPMLQRTGRMECMA